MFYLNENKILKKSLYTKVVRIPFFQFKLWRDPCGVALRHDFKT